MDTQTKPWTEMTEFERFVHDLEGTLLAHADAKDVKVVIERLERADIARLQRAADEQHKATLSGLRSHAFPHCEVCGTAVDDPEAMETCASPAEVMA